MACDSIDVEILARLAQNVRAARLSSGLDVGELAGLTGIAADVLAGIEDGSIDPEISVIGILADALDRPASELIGDEPE